MLQTLYEMVNGSSSGGFSGLIAVNDGVSDLIAVNDLIEKPRNRRWAPGLLLDLDLSTKKRTRTERERIEIVAHDGCGKAVRRTGWTRTIILNRRKYIRCDMEQWYLARIYKN